MLTIAGMLTKLTALLGRAWMNGQLDYETFEYAVRVKIAFEEALDRTGKQS